MPGSDPRSPIPFRALREAGFCVAAVLTQPDKPTGRKRILTPNPMKVAAQEAGVPVFDFARVRDHAAALAAVGADCMVTCAYGQILTADVLAAFPRGVFNVHTSLLAPLAGARSPIQSAILAGDAETGVTIMRTELGLDTGDVLLRARLPIEETDTAGTLADKLFALGAACIVTALTQVEQGTETYEKQNEADATFCQKDQKEDGALDFTGSARQLCRLVRAMDPEPLAFTRCGGKLVNILSAIPAEGAAGACGEVVRADKTGIYVAAGDGCLCIRALQFEGGKRLSAADAVNGRKVCVGDVFGAGGADGADGGGR